MVSLEIEALHALNTLIGALLDSIDPNPDFTVLPHQITRSGLGGFVAVHDDPQGDILGCKVEASLEIAVRDSHDDIQAVNIALLGLSPQQQREYRILKLEMETSHIGATAARRVLQYAMVYEYLRVPEAGEFIIAEIPIDLQVDNQNVS